MSPVDGTRFGSEKPCTHTARGFKSLLLRHTPRHGSTARTSVTVSPVAEGQSTLQRLGRRNAEGAAFSIARPSLTRRQGRERSEAREAVSRHFRPC